MSETMKCELCGEPMPAGEEIFKFHGYSGPCPKPPLAKRANDTKHTPGPWRAERDFRVDGDRDIESFDIKFDMFGSIARVHDGYASGNTLAANARLIAAAPDLLAACRALLAACRALPLGTDFSDAADFVDASEKSHRAMDLARAAIATVEGCP